VLTWSFSTPTPPFFPSRHSLFSFFFSRAAFFFLCSWRRNLPPSLCCSRRAASREFSSSTSSPRPAMALGTLVAGTTPFLPPFFCPWRAGAFPSHGRPALHSDPSPWLHRAEQFLRVRTRAVARRRPWPTIFHGDRRPPCSWVTGALYGFCPPSSSPWSSALPSPRRAPPALSTLYTSRSYSFPWWPSTATSMDAPPPCSRQGWPAPCCRRPWLPSSRKLSPLPAPFFSLCPPLQTASPLLTVLRGARRLFVKMCSKPYAAGSLFREAR
jgi:hypothetical protein